MSQWLVTQGDNQFSVSGLEELKKMASSGRLSPGDMIQPPGASDWLYASEVEDLKGLLRDGGGLDDVDFSYRGNRGLSGGILAALFAVILLGAGGTMAYFFTKLPTGDEAILGAGGLCYSNMLTTQAASLRVEPKAGGKAVTALQKDQKLSLLAKRDAFYKARTSDGQEGWVEVSEVVPMYKFGDKSIRAQYDPLYNPDQYVTVKNATWMVVEGNKSTTFQFVMHNDSIYEMSNLVLEASITDSKGNEVGRQEFAIEGTIPAEASTFVGTLKAENERDPEAKTQLLTTTTFEKMAEEDEDLNLRWVDGVEVELEENFTGAVIRIVELRALPSSDLPDCKGS